MSQFFVSILLLLLMLVASGCSRLQSTWSHFASPIAVVDLIINDVKVTQQSGNISLEGIASLPDGTQLAVSAVRVLDNTPSRDPSSKNPAYAILDRQFVTIKDEQWQADLNLYEANASGVYFENWQLNNSQLLEKLAPNPAILLMVTLEPTSFSPAISDLLANAVINGGSSQLSYTLDGEPYLQISRSIVREIPSAANLQADDSAISKADEMWQNRSNYNPTVDDVNDGSQLPFAEEDNLPLPAVNMMQ